MVGSSNLLLPVRLNDAATAESRAAARDYEARRAGLGTRFVARLNQTLAQIARHPDSCQAVNHRYRPAVLHHFPFIVVYRIMPEHVEVVGILPSRSDPEILTHVTGSTPG